jgi:uncharacterized RDD family membrane protein YckC
MYAINVGGVIIPLIVAAFFIYKLKRYSAFLVLMIGAVSFVSFILSSIEPNVGVVITYPGYFVVILLSVMLSFMVFRKSPGYTAPAAYVSSTLGVLIGADIMFLWSTIPSSWKVGYIGGGGIFDLVFLSGLFAMAGSLVMLGVVQKYKTIQTVQMARSSGDPGVNEVTKERHHKFSTLNKRLLAFLIDILLQGIVFIGIIITGIFLLDLDPAGITQGLVGYTIFWWLIVFHIMYFVIFEYYTGQTPGKKFVNIRVVSLSIVGNREKIRSRNHDLLGIFTRNFLRIVDLILVIFILFWISQLPKRQRLGDIFANTGVICS